MTSTGDTDRTEQPAQERTRELPEYTRGKASPVGWPEDAPDEERWAGRVPRGRGCLLPLAAAVVLIVALVVGLRAVGWWPSFSNPFAEQETDRSQPPLLKSIQDLSRYTAAEGNFQVVIDLQKNRKYVPDFLVNERTLFVAAGSVEAYVDFSTISQGAVVESADGTAVEIKLPAPQLAEPRLDLERSYVFAEQRGLLNRVGDVFGEDPNRQKEVYQRAEDDIAKAAQDTELLQRAQENTRKMLEGLLRSLGYKTVTITFPAP